MHLSLKPFAKDQRGAVIIEFAYCLPIFMGLGVSGIELSNMSAISMRVNQIAVTIADNLSRAKQTVALGQPELREHDISDAFRGAQIQSNEAEILRHGRIIVSSLQQNSSGGQWIAWQRCKGLKNVVSSYGVEGTGLTGTAYPGLGPGTNAQKLKAPANAAIIFVEVTYDYQPLISQTLFGPITFREEKSFYVRDDRKLIGGTDGNTNGVFNPSPKATVSRCNIFSAS